MKTVSVESLKLDVSKLAHVIRAAKSAPVILTQNGHAICKLAPLDDFDQELLALGQDPKFLALLERSRDRLRKEGGISHKELWRRLDMREKKPRGTVSGRKK